jgi:hypothetical protein
MTTKKNHLMTKIKLFFITIFITLIPSLLYSQVTIFSENFGTPSSTTSVSTYTGFQNYGVKTYTGNADVRTTTNSMSCSPASSTACYTGASGSGNLFITNALNTNLIISGINTLNYNTLSLTLGLLKTTNASNGSELGIQVSTDAVTWTNLTFTMVTGGGTSNWYSITPTGTIPSTANLRIRFIMKSVVSGLQFRVDDIKLTGALKIALPLTMGSFNIQKSKIGCILVWETYNEKNVDKFVIMKSTDGYEWKGIKELKARGTTTFKELYTFVDTEVSSLNYYQLFIYDNDGAYIKSKVVGINNKTELILPKKLYNILGQEILYGEQYGIPGQ